MTSYHLSKSLQSDELNSFIFMCVCKSKYAVYVYVSTYIEYYECTYRTNRFSIGCRVSNMFFHSYCTHTSSTKGKITKTAPSYITITISE